MSDTTGSNKRLEAFLRLLGSTRQLGAQATLYALGLGAIALAGNSGDTGALSAFVSAAGINAISVVLDRIAGNTLSEDDIRRQVNIAIDQSGIATAFRVSGVQMMIAKLFRELDVIAYAIQSSEFDILKQLSEQAKQYETFALGLQHEVALVYEKLDSLATRQQLDQIIALLKDSASQPDVINYVVRGLSELPTRYDGRVKNFLEYYLGASDSPAPFGGREVDLNALDQWLTDPRAPHYNLLVAPAGRGKSGLLAHWLPQLATKDNVATVYFPISIRFNTNHETVVFASLAARMAHLYGEKVTEAFDAQQYRGVFSDYLRRSPVRGQTVLIILDGLDEAAGWEANADLFPTIPPDHLKVIVAARPLAGDASQDAWIHRLGWNPANTKRFDLGRLDREGVADVLTRMGNPLDKLAVQVDMVGKLHELSEGDPLLVRLYVEALIQHGEAAAACTAEDLLKLKPGFDDYFAVWFEEQRKLWGTASPLKDKSVQGLLNISATALGPLKREDVLALAPEYFEKSSWVVQEAAHALNRFILGDGETVGYVFSHPRLNEYFASRLSIPEREEWQRRFLRYGKETVQRLEAKSIQPAQASAYIVQYYGAHLERGHAPDEDFFALVCESWLRAWEATEGTPAGFLNDVRLAWNRAENRGAVGLGMQIRSALCFASVASVSASINTKLLVGCVEAGAISSTLALVIARRKPDLAERATSLIGIAEYLAGSQRVEAMLEALSTARSIVNPSHRARVLAKLAPQLPEEEQATIWGEALRAVRSIGNEQARTQLLVELAAHLPKDLLAEVLNIARGITDVSNQARVLVELAPQLPNDLLSEALGMARSIANASDRALVLGVLTSQMPEEERATVSAEALTASRGIANVHTRARVLRELAPRLSENLLPEALNMARSIANEPARVRVLRELVPQLPMDLLPEAFTMAHDIANVSTRARILGALAARMSDAKRYIVLGEALSITRSIASEPTRARVLRELAPQLPMDLLREALKIARYIANVSDRVPALSELAQHLPEDERINVLRDAFDATRSIANESTRVRVLRELAPQLPGEQRAAALGEALNTARGIADETSCARVLIGLAPQLPKDLLTEALYMARSIANVSARAQALGELAPHLSGAEQASVFSEALNAARSVGDEAARARTLGTLASLLPEERRGSVFSHALRAARSIVNATNRSRVLGTLASLLPAEEQSTVFSQALRAARSIPDASTQGRILCELAPELPKDLFPEALNMARRIANELARAQALHELAMQLPEDERSNVLREALGVAQGISSDIDRARVLGRLALQLPEQERVVTWGEALNAARSITYVPDRVRILRELMPSLPKDLLRDVLSIARGIPHAPDRARVLCELVAQLPQEERGAILREALRIARRAPNASDRARAMRILASQLSKDLFPEALNIARGIANELARARVLGTLALQIPEEERAGVLSEALYAARSVANVSDRAHVLGELASQMCEEEQATVLSEALSAARSITNVAARARALRELVARWPEKEQAAVFREALFAARSIADVSARMRVLRELAPQLPGNSLAVLLDIVREAPGNAEATEILDYLTQNWAQASHISNRSQLTELSLTLRAYANAQRKYLLDVVRALSPVLTEFGQQSALQETVQAILDTAGWWP